ncbi:MAG: methyltransferase domain-containing protein [Candidatus Thorarchaeota archaeon]|nr:methyltransferase domain-containing protein [Candidatus Thorarchaeota archaeon]
MFKNTIDYDKVSKVYDQVRTGDPEMVHQILDGVSVTQDSLVLDMGCGTGNNTLLFAVASQSLVLGLDISFGMLEKAHEKKSSLPLVQAPADNLPFTSDSFDLVFMTEVIHHLPNILGSFEETYRILKRPGSLCIVTQSHAQIDHRMTSRFFPASAKIDKARYPDVDEIEDLLFKTGFNEVNPIPYVFKPVRLGNDYLETVTKRGYSMLHKIHTEDYERGLRDLQVAFASGEELSYSAEYTFIWSYKR